MPHYQGAIIICQILNAGWLTWLTPVSVHKDCSLAHVTVNEPWTNYTGHVAVITDNRLILQASVNMYTMSFQSSCTPTSFVFICCFFFQWGFFWGGGGGRKQKVCAMFLCCLILHYCLYKSHKNVIYNDESKLLEHV